MKKVPKKIEWRLKEEREETADFTRSGVKKINDLIECVEELQDVMKAVQLDSFGHVVFSKEKEYTIRDLKLLYFGWNKEEGGKDYEGRSSAECFISWLEEQENS